jgi:hypothetical protein
MYVSHAIYGFGEPGLILLSIRAIIATGASVLGSDLYYSLQNLIQQHMNKLTGVRKINIRNGIALTNQLTYGMYRIAVD